MRHAPGRRLRVLRGGEPGGGEVLRRVRGPARRCARGRARADPARCHSRLQPATPAIAGAPGASTAAVAERRLVSVLFADLVGFTTLAEHRDAEEVRELLSRYFDLARGIVEGHGGTIEKFIGDAVMAVWGTPTSHEDDAERAVRAALELVAAVRGLGPSVEARAGVLTGEAAVTIGAVGEGMVAGDMVNTASRLQAAAPAGIVLVGEATMHAASRAIAFEEAGEHLLKGKAAPVAAWRALRVVAERGGRGRSASLEAPFVGRDDELRLLKDLYHATTRDRRVRLVSVTGQGGIGKSRLAWEFLKYIDGLVETVYWHQGRSPSYGSGITFWALGEMVRERAGLAEVDDEATTRARIAETVAGWVPDERERRWIEQSLLALLGVGDPPAGGQDQLFSAWRTLFERIAADAPVVMVFEDLQWADSGLLAFIDHLVEWSRGVPIYVVALARPELLETRPDWGAGKRNFTSLALEPLTPAAMHELLAGLVPGLPDDATARIVARADGVPLYAVEIVRMLVAQGSLEAGGRCLPAGGRSRRPGRPRYAALAHRGAPRCARTGRPRHDPGSRGARPLVHGGRAGRRRRARRRRGRAPAARARPARARRPRRRPAVHRARPVRVRPVARARGRLLDARPPRPQVAPPGRRPPLRDARGPGAGGGAGERTTWPPTATRPRVPRPMPSRRRRGSRSGRPATAPSRWARRSRRSASTATRWR